MLSIIILEMHSGSTCLITGTAANTSFRIEFYLAASINGFRIVAPPASEIASFEENRRSDTRAVMYGKFLDIKQLAFHGYYYLFFPVITELYTLER